jgi:hypothetical protein
VSGRKVEFDEVIVPPPDSSTPQKEISMTPAQTGVEVDNDDHETSEQVATEL